jgi:hypothetical protein
VFNKLWKILVHDEIKAPKYRLYSNTCRALYSLCLEEEHKERDYCIEYCGENPDRMGCRTSE